MNELSTGSVDINRLSATAQLEKTHSNLADLRQRLVGLREYLSPILGPEYATDQADGMKNPDEQQSTIIEQIRAVNDTINEMHDMVRSITDRIQL